jgi:integrase/recombinase XerC
VPEALLELDAIPGRPRASLSRALRGVNIRQNLRGLAHAPRNEVVSAFCAGSRPCCSFSRDTPLGEHVVAYLHALEYGEASLNTLLAYEHVLALFAVEHADLSLDELEPPQGGGVVRAFLDRHWNRRSATTRRQRLAITRSFLTWLTGEGLLRSNPAVNIRAPKTTRRERRALPLEDVEKLIAAQPALRDQVALMLLAWLGLRKGELRALRIADFNLAAGAVTVHGKGGHEDKLPLGFERLRTALELHLVEREPHPDEFLLYPKTFRTRPDPASVHNWLKRCLRLAGLPLDVQTHELRHTAAEALYRQTGDIVLAQQLLRHTDIRTTRGYLRAHHKNVCARLWPSSRPRGISALAFCALLRLESPSAR